MHTSVRTRAAAALAAVTAAVPAARSAAQTSHEAHAAAAVSATAAPPHAPRLGRVRMATSAAPAAREPFLRGVLYLHNFHYPEAAAAFRDAERLDPGDVMSVWGEAMTYTHPLWGYQDVDSARAARAALARLGPTREARLARARTPRERDYLDAVETLYGPDSVRARRDSAYTAAMARLHARYPDDDEAVLFHALALLSLSGGDRDTVAYGRAADIAEGVFRRHPDDPGAAHYLIHAVDDPAHARRGLAAARAYTALVPDASHAQHMTSHIFVAMGIWDDVVAANERALAAVPQPTSGVVHVTPHDVVWLGYGLLQQGRFAEARRWIKLMRAQAAREPNGMNAAHTAMMAAAYTIDTRQWTAPYATLRVDTTGFGGAVNAFTVGYAAAARGDRAVADSVLARMAAKHAGHAGDGSSSHKPGREDAWEWTVRGAALRAAGQRDSALALFRAAADVDESLPFAYGPPAAVQPPRELVGDVLLELGRPAEAAREFARTLERTPARPAALLGLARAQRAAGDAPAAARTYAQLAEIWRRADADVPGLSEVRAGAGRPGAGR